MANFKIIPTALFLNGSRIDAIPDEPGEVLKHMGWGTPDVFTFYTPREVASAFGLHKSRKPALAFFAGVEYVHVSKAARRLAKNMNKPAKNNSNWVPGTTTRDRKRYRRMARVCAGNSARAGCAEKAVTWRKRARNG